MQFLIYKNVNFVLNYSKNEFTEKKERKINIIMKQIDVSLHSDLKKAYFFGYLIILIYSVFGQNVLIICISI